MDILKEAQKVARGSQRKGGILRQKIRKIPRLVCTAMGAALGAGGYYLLMQLF